MTQRFPGVLAIPSKPRTLVSGFDLATVAPRPPEKSPLENSLEELCLRWGKKEVQNALQRVPGKRGRPKHGDYPLLAPWIKQDARDIVEGRDPFKERTNYRVANEFAKTHPGHSPTATVSRIIKKLNESRYWMSLDTARSFAEKDTDVPWPVLREILVRLCEQNKLLGFYLADMDRLDADLALHEQRCGKPNPALSIAAIRMQTEAARPVPQGLGGILMAELEKLEGLNRPIKKG